jgi:4-hydroxybenzoate polyprenyltransferase
MLTRLRSTLEFIKFSHTLFALPFALISMLVAAGGLPHLRIFGWILVCLVSARTAAMAFNRYADWEYDIQNPRTAGRSKLASKGTALGLILFSLAVFVTATHFLNFLCFFLSPVAIVLILGYSLTKRFTAYSHAFLGLALAAAPMGAWAAVRGDLRMLAPWLLAAAVLCWVFGFDLIYATQDVEFDRANGLHSFPARYGVDRALVLARVLHGLAWLILIAFGLSTSRGMVYWWGLGGVALALAAEHWLSRSGDLQKINVAFFQINALVGALLLAGTGIDLWMH